MFNIALGFSMLLSAMILLLFKPLHGLTPATVCGFALLLFVFLRFTSAGQYLKPSKLIHYAFGIANTLILAGICLFILGTNDGAHANGANTIGAAIFVGVYFLIPALALLLCASIALAVQSIRKTASRQQPIIKPS
jgi:hypothetical protein